MVFKLCSHEVFWKYILIIPVLHVLTFLGLVNCHLVKSTLILQRDITLKTALNDS